MKVYLIVIFYLSSLVSFGQEMRLDTIVPSSNELFPLDSCFNYIYAVTSGVKNKKVDYYDTVAINHISNWRDYKTLQLSDHRQLLSRHDSIFYKEPTQNGQMEIILLYWPTKQKDTRPIILGGDAIGGKQYSEAIGYYRINNKIYSNCYKFTRQMEFNEVIIISNGIGIISVANISGVKVLHKIERKKNCQ